MQRARPLEKIAALDERLVAADVYALAGLLFELWQALVRQTRAGARSAPREAAGAPW